MTLKQGQWGFLETGMLEASPGSGRRETWFRCVLCFSLCAPERLLHLEAQFCPPQGNRGALPSSY